MGPWKLKEIRQLEEEIVQQKNGISQKHQGKKLEEEKQVVRSAGGQQEGCFPQKHSDCEESRNRETIKEKEEVCGQSCVGESFSRTKDGRCNESHCAEEPA